MKIIKDDNLPWIDYNQFKWVSYQKLHIYFLLMI